MSLNSLPIDSSSCDYYDAISNTTSHPHINNCSSLRVRFRMVTHKSSQIQNKIQISSSSSLSHASLPRPPTNIPFTRGYIGPHSNAQPHVEYHETSFEEKTVCYDTYAEAIPINIGTGSPSPQTIKTFQLTEDLKSNIKLDIQLNPNYSLRGNRVNSSTSRSNSCGKRSSSDLRRLNSANSVEFYERSKRNYLEKVASRSNLNRDLATTTTNTYTRDVTSRYSRFYQTMPDQHSSLIRLTFNTVGNGSANNKIMINHYKSLPRRGEGDECCSSSPFTYIETSSTKRSCSEIDKAYKNFFSVYSFIKNSLSKFLQAD